MTRRLTWKEKLFVHCFMEAGYRPRIVFQRKFDWPEFHKCNLAHLTAADILAIYDDALREREDPRTEVISIYFALHQPDMTLWMWENYESLAGSDLEEDQDIAFLQHQHANLHN